MVADEQPDLKLPRICCFPDTGRPHTIIDLALELGVFIWTEILLILGWLRR